MRIPCLAFNVLRISLALWATLLLAGCEGKPQSVTVQAADYGDRWPYPGFKSGVIRCIRPNPYNAVVIKLGDVEYGMNGSSFSHFPDSREHVAINQEWGTYELGALSELIQLGLDLCSEPASLGY